MKENVLSHSKIEGHLMAQRQKRKMLQSFNLIFI
jgi:hypothetical protein